ncbi:MAG: hypothetical protein JW915_20085 [Chitinispirillaceae bacterium]|nr:hypothetical protein [Chitinispirillaceae bacterium]
MKCGFTYLAVFVLFASSFTQASDQSVKIKIGPVWPRALFGNDNSIAWDASIVSGKTFDNRVTIGGGIDFLWNYTSKETRVNKNSYRVDMEEKTFMFPVSVYLSLTPLPDLKVTPSLNGQLGLNTMYYSRDERKKDVLTPDSGLVDENGWYMGVYWKLAADAILTLSESTGFFVGLEYQHSKPVMLGDGDDDSRVRRNMSGLGLRFGLNIIR